jgi:hypothetical protein
MSWRDSFPSTRARARRKRAEFEERLSRRREELTAKGLSQQDVDADIDAYRSAEADLEWEEERLAQQQRLLRKAHRWGIFPPSADQYWEDSYAVSERRLLSDHGVAKLTKDLQEAFDRRVDLVVKVATALTGIIGALIGLASVLSRN